MAVGWSPVGANSEWSLKYIFQKYGKDLKKFYRN
jgi:hypothetical protein